MRLELDDVDWNQSLLIIRESKYGNYAKVEVMRRCRAGVLKQRAIAGIDLDIITGSQGSEDPLPRDGTDVV